MFDYFGFDARTLTDDELMAKMADLQAKVVYASWFSSSDLIMTLQGILQAIQFEQSERLARRVHAQQDAMFPDVIESDPGLANAGGPAPSPERGKIVPQPRPRMTITKTSRPVDPGPPGAT